MVDVRSALREYAANPVQGPDHHQFGPANRPGIPS
jgi:hypothetical protein